MSNQRPEVTAARFEEALSAMSRSTDAVRSGVAVAPAPAGELAAVLGQDLGPELRSSILLVLLILAPVALLALLVS